ncbi:MAG: hypothetical protein DWQ09_01335 [Proteobacteria bacterium]|nr:MAG: hypothetical protein DWQ09_01335 [Pseudomonadota bacterium]
MSHNCHSTIIRYASVSAGPSPMIKAIGVQPDAVSLSALREHAGQVVLPHCLQRLAGFVESFAVAVIFRF